MDLKARRIRVRRSVTYVPGRDQPGSWPTSPASTQHRAVRQARRAAEPAGLRRQFVDYDGLYEAKLDAINRTNALSLLSAAGTK